ncbi:MAG: DMT family transporter [Hyphomicrobiales bacterium]|nr:DMT family transporter [Hyphomicrobiales bacterium]
MIDGLWIPITIAAAFLQNLRSAVQKHLKGRLSTTGATFVRFGYGVPLAIVYVAVLHYGLGMDWPAPNGAFLVYAAGGGLAQIIATFLLVHLFSFRNFAVGTAYSKTEPVQAAIFGIIILGDQISPGAAVAILVGLAGVMAISVAHHPMTLGALVRSLAERTALIGLVSGAFFGISAVLYRAASLSLGGPGFLMQAGFTLACVSAFQTVVMLAYMRWREPGQITACLRHWRPALLVGVAGICGSACWFTAMTIQNVAYVRALGQIELVFTFAASYFFFRERVNRMEAIGIALIVACILILLLGR